MDADEARTLVRELGERRDVVRKLEIETSDNLSTAAAAAMQVGVPKAEIARLARVSRVTLDAWLQREEKT
jgi:hypothetical protein